MSDPRIDRLVAAAGVYQAQATANVRRGKGLIDAAEKVGGLNDAAGVRDWRLAQADAAAGAAVDAGDMVKACLDGAEALRILAEFRLQYDGTFIGDKIAVFRLPAGAVRDARKLMAGVDLGRWDSSAAYQAHHPTRTEPAR